MNVLHGLGKRLSTQLTAGLFVVFGLAACALAGYPDKGEERPLPEVNFTLTADGRLIAKDNSGKPLGTECSTNPKDTNVCPLLKPGHEVQVEQLTNVSVVKYHGSPQCYLLIVNGRAYVIPGMQYCSN